ncbi:helix-turn-helix transcriptional regulator [Ornithinimicrobium sp. F0845]|uniref:heat shock protein transcriptional repressor HspR n=1 Tax=Ornithinimicrobium sp. F0845 TaxID=2926412 RepID=UPI001FF19465|nr:helix-turn-helix transcriptional regulator [Ornithinimicrobium sp. F0845]MCK0112706.1 helix-turn-helix transcriptional regulator [Ornithinimicrobium sp. F0845]
MARQSNPDEDTPVYVISIAAELAGMHAQTLRQYDRLGLVTPQRTRGGVRRYSARDVSRLREVQRLSQDEGVSLAGIQRIMVLEHQVDALRERTAELLEQNRVLREALDVRSRVFAAGPSGEAVVMRPGTRPRQESTTTAVALWRPLPF